MKKIIYILILTFALISCRSPQNIAIDRQVKDQRETENNIELVNTQQLDEVISNAVQKAINDKLNIDFKHVKYDTDKPVDPETGKPPVKEETNVNLKRETETQTSDTTNIKRSVASDTQLKDKSKEKVKTEIKNKEKQSPALKWWQKMFIVIGIVSLSGFAIWLYFKIKK